jgi:hypothetical protein
MKSKRGMIRYVIVFIIFFVSVDAIGQPRCELKSCKIEYEFFDGINSGYKTLIFTDSGLIEKLIITAKTDTSKMPAEMKLMFKEMPREVKQLKIQTRNNVFLIDLISMTGEKQRRYHTGFQLPGPLLSKIGNDTFLQKTCEVYDVKVSKIWYWKGVAIKKELAFNEGGMIYERAISIDENYIIKKDEFKVPVNVKF